MNRVIRGRARRFGDDVNTDYIITSTRKRDTLDERTLAQYLFETVDPAFAATVRRNDVIVAGRNFGCGSAMEVAATVILAAGIPAVIATSFSRTFYRNAINNGLLPVELDTQGIVEGDALTIEASESMLRVVVDRMGVVGTPGQIAGTMAEVLEAGGLVEYIKRRSGPRY